MFVLNDALQIRMAQFSSPRQPLHPVMWLEINPLFPNADALYNAMISAGSLEKMRDPDAMPNVDNSSLPS